MIIFQNVSINETATEHFNGNKDCLSEKLGDPFNMELETDKSKDTALIQDMERIQKDTTDFCNIQVIHNILKNII